MSGGDVLFTLICSHMICTSQELSFCVISWFCPADLAIPADSISDKHVLHWRRTFSFTTQDLVRLVDPSIRSVD